MPTIRTALAHARGLLETISCTAELDARILLQHCIDKDLAWVITRADEQLNPRHNRCFKEYVARRQQGEPVAYITGKKEFWSLTLAVNENVLIPRPETEHLVERALTHLPEYESRKVVDLGTGSGAIALAIAKERPLCDITAIDISPAALEVAVANANRLETYNVSFSLSDWFYALSGQTFDLIVCNPPYVVDNEECLNSDLAHEPSRALRGGPEGLDAVSVISAEAGKHLSENGWLILEHGATQKLQIEKLLSANGFEKIICYEDHVGQPRVTECCGNTRSGCRDN